MCVEEQSQRVHRLRLYGRHEGILHPRAELEEQLRALWLSCRGAMAKLQGAMAKLPWLGYREL